MKKINSDTMKTLKSMAVNSNALVVKLLIPKKCRRLQIDLHLERWVAVSHNYILNWYTPVPIFCSFQWNHKSTQIIQGCIIIGIGTNTIT